MNISTKTLCVTVKYIIQSGCFFFCQVYLNWQHCWAEKDAMWHMSRPQQDFDFASKGAFESIQRPCLKLN